MSVDREKPRPGVRFVDRLRERGAIDRVGFLGFALGGAVLIFIAKSVNMNSVLVAGLAAAAILSYAFLVQRTGTGRLRSDQAGDNCYYLGLIYTLASLAHAIFTFDPAQTATTIVQGFGIALVTTILGLVLRVYFNQSRPDLAENEAQARMELAEATGRFKAELSRSVVSMNDFGRQTRQSLEELRDEVLTSLKAVKQSSEQAVAEMSRQATTAVAENSDAAVARAKKLTTATDKVVGGMEGNAAALAGMQNASEQIAASLTALEGAAARSQELLEGLIAQSQAIGVFQQGSATTARDLAEATSLLNQHVAGLNASTGRLEEVLVAKLEEIQAVPQGVAVGAIQGISETLGRLRDDIRGILEAQSSVTLGLAAQVQQSAEAANRHNAALEAEVARSRESVARVHSSLVDMTEQLARRAEGRT